MRYAIGILTSDNNLYACHEVADSEQEAVLNALQSVDLYDGEPVDNLREYLKDTDVEVNVYAIADNYKRDKTDRGCVLAKYDADGELVADYYPKQTAYDAMLHLLGGIVPLRQMRNLKDLITFIEDTGILVDCKEVTYPGE
jgi:hypothetical protein